MDEIEQRAEELLEQIWFWDGASVPVPVEDIADSHCSLYVREVEDMQAAPGCPPLGEGQSLSGLLLPGRGEIWVNGEEVRRWPRRRRFTIGHEVGHWVLHQREQTSLFCRNGAVDPDEKQKRPALDPIEEEANLFAAALLMPAHLVRHHYERTGGDFDRLCQLFDVSGAAMGRRLHAVI